MKLTFEQIKSVTVGSVDTEERDGGIHFAKCTKKQIESWRQKNPTLGVNCAATTGVRLDLHTNSQNVSVKVLGGKKYEILVDGLMFRQYTPEAGEVISLELSDPIGVKKDEYRVTVICPSHGEPAVIEYVELDDGAYIKPHRFDRRLLFIGDSITQGYASSHEFYSYAYRVSHFFNAESVIQGTGGAYFHEDSFDHIDFYPDAVIMAYGTNDFGHYKTYDELRAHAEAHMALIAEEYKGKKLFYISPIWRDKREGKAMGSFEGCRSVLIESAEKYGFEHIDGLTLVPPRPELYQDGYLHPNDNGFSFYAENLIGRLIGKI
ncbi:MAG: SGNH/GDSL hydrolase family protein [Clostridia bacterium]|nr:SGNH/GDSL hydrolase family protein [Clostridia bacterium]